MTHDDTKSMKASAAVAKSWHIRYQHSSLDLGGWGG